MDNSESDSYSVSERDFFDENYVMHALDTDRPELEYLSIDFPSGEEVHERTYGKEIWEMSDNPLYEDTDRLVRDISNAKNKLFLGQLYKENEETYINFNVLKDYSLIEYIDVLKTLILANNGDTTIIITYVKLLLTYNKYNKLNILKTKTKLNDDIIFNIIIKYL